jgi:hypothetical protein
MKRKNQEIGKCVICGKPTRVKISFGKSKVYNFYCGCKGPRAG